MTYPYVMTAGKFSEFLQKLHEFGVPDKFDRPTLKSWGFKSSNHHAFITTVKFVGLIDDSGVPTELWKQARGDLGGALAKGIRSDYAPLFKLYPDAQRKDDEALRNFFSQNTDVGAKAVAAMVATFKAMVGLANFDAEDDDEDAGLGKPTGAGKTKEQRDDRRTPNVENIGGSGGPTINVNIQLQVPPDATGEMYDKFFEAMKKHLWPEKLNHSLMSCSEPKG